jgi:SM-20-related protein
MPMSDTPLRDDEAPASSGIMPPYLVWPDFLDRETLTGLMQYTLSREADFAPTKIATRSVDPAKRVSTAIRDLAEYREPLQRRIFDLLPDLTKRLGVGQIVPSSFETELVAHGDGAFFTQHIDTFTGAIVNVSEIRVLSGVYYFHAEPKAFSGGAFRLYAIGGRPGTAFVDIEPKNNTFLIFPSWAPHEVMPVSCPSGRFADSRFAINCWILRKKASDQHQRTG